MTTPIFVARPAVALGEYEVSREEILADIETRHADHPRLAAIRRVLARLPSRRRFSQPWRTVISARALEQRNATSFADAVRLGTAAARQLLTDHQVDPARVDCIITSTATHDAIPGMDAHLVRDLALRPDVSRRPMTQLGCAGGAHGIVMAADYVRARPGSIALVVVADSLSSMYHHTDTTIGAFIYKALWGDSGSAVLVSDQPFGPGLEVVDTWEFLLPDTTDRYKTRIDGDGLHFDSLPEATSSVREVAPHLRAWLERPLPTRGTYSPASGGQEDGADGPWPLDFTVSHTGGPAILRDLAEQLRVDEKLLRHSWESLDQVGNLGGGSVLDVLDRTYTTPPASGDTGMLIGFGPGFAVSAAKVVWRDEV